MAVSTRMPVQPNVKQEIAALLDRKDHAALRKLLEPWLPADLAPNIADLPIGQLAALFRVSSRELAAATFTYMPLEAQKRLLKLLTQDQVAALLNALPPDDRTAFLNELPLDLAMQLLAMLTPDERQVAQSLLAYPAHSVGRMMTLDFIAVRPEWSVREALDYIREHGYDRETLNIVFVTDAAGHLVDDIRVRRLLLSPLDRPVRELLDGNYTWLSPTDDREKALGLFRKFDRVALPVVDDQRKIIGIVTFDDMLDVAEAEATEDIQKLGGTEALDEPYTTIALSRMVKKRASSSWPMRSCAARCCRGASHFLAASRKVGRPLRGRPGTSGIATRRPCAERPAHPCGADTLQKTEMRPCCSGTIRVT